MNTNNRGTAQPSFQISCEILKLVDEAARNIGVSRSDLIRIALSEKLSSLSGSKSNSNSYSPIGGA